MASRVQTVQVEDTFDGVTHTLQLQGVKKIDDNATNVGCTGTTTWATTSHLVNYLMEQPGIVRGKTVLEHIQLQYRAPCDYLYIALSLRLHHHFERTSKLGAGLGLVGLVAHKLGAARVVLTDGDDSALQLMQANVAANVELINTTTTTAADIVPQTHHHSTSSAAADSSTAAPNVASEQQCQHQNDSVCCCLLQWGNAEQIQQALHHCNCDNSTQEHSNTQKFNIVLGGEVIYDGNRADLDSLFQTVLACTHADSSSSTTVVFYMAFRQRLVPLDESKEQLLHRA
eukprot:10986-Heterococcus_DN1.PRE.2